MAARQSGVLAGHRQLVELVLAAVLTVDIVLSHQLLSTFSGQVVAVLAAVATLASRSEVLLELVPIRLALCVCVCVWRSFAVSLLWQHLQGNSVAAPTFLAALCQTTATTTTLRIRLCSAPRTPHQQPAGIKSFVCFVRVLNNTFEVYVPQFSIGCLTFDQLLMSKPNAFRLQSFQNELTYLSQ